MRFFAALLVTLLAAGLPAAEAGRVAKPVAKPAAAVQKAKRVRTQRALKRTKARPQIIATVGPPSSQVPTLRRMVRGGMKVARINLSHNNKRSSMKMASAIRKAAKAEGRTVPLLFDLPGGKVRLGKMGAQSVTLKPGQTFELLPGGKVATTSKSASVGYKHLAKHAQVGETVLLDDGRIELEVTQVSAKAIKTVVKRGGGLRSRMGMALKNVELPFPAMTAQDRRKLKIAVDAGASWIGVSMVQSPKNLSAVRRALAKLGASDVKVVAKIESKAAMKNLDAIIQASDAVMIARGDLSTVVGPRGMPAAQRRIAEASRRNGKPFIVATNLMSGMISGPAPTRANRADVDRAQRQGSRWLMLNETALSAKPAEIVEAVTGQLK